MPVLPTSGVGGPPSTYTPNDAIALVQNFAHGIPLTPVAAQLCDIVNSMMWCFYPWSWTIGSLTPIQCVQGQQDYTPTDTDILRPLKFRIVRTDVTPNEYRELVFLANLAPEKTRTGGLETITSCGYFASGPFIRLLYATSISGNQSLQIQGEYQIVPPKITSDSTSSTDLSTAFSFPDRYFNVFVEGLKWKVYQLADDPRAGSMVYAKNGSRTMQYTGQLGLFMDALLTMARTEDLQAGDEFMFPENPIGVGRSYWPGLYGV